MQRRDFLLATVLGIAGVAINAHAEGIVPRKSLGDLGKHSGLPAATDKRHRDDSEVVAALQRIGFSGDGLNYALVLVALAYDLLTDVDLGALAKSDINAWAAAAGAQNVGLEADTWEVQVLLGFSEPPVQKALLSGDVAAGYNLVMSYINSQVAPLFPSSTKDIKTNLRGTRPTTLLKDLAAAFRSQPQDPQPPTTPAVEGFVAEIASAVDASMLPPRFTPDMLQRLLRLQVGRQLGVISTVSDNESDWLQN